jgi:hypothetical protein
MYQEKKWKKERKGTKNLRSQFALILAMKQAA